MPMFLDAALILSTLLLAPIMIPCVMKGPVAAFTESTPRHNPAALPCQAASEFTRLNGAAQSWLARELTCPHRSCNTRSSCT